MSTITALPTAPQRSDTANFAVRMDAWVQQFTTLTTTEVNTVAGEVNANAATATAQAAAAAVQAALATAQATAAANSATTAASVVGVSVWASGTYARYSAAISPADGLTYRKIGATGTSSIDPKYDTVNWVGLNGVGIAASYPSIRPVLQLDFANSRFVDSRIAVTRASGATYTTPAGLQATAGNNVLRVDYDPATLACSGALLEPASTNLLLWSNKISNAAWSKGGTTVTANATLALDGTLTADKLVEDTSTGLHVLYQGSTSAVASTPYTATIKAKAGERYNLQINLDDGSSSGLAVSADLSNGTINTPASYGTASGATASISLPDSNGDYKITLSGTPLTSGVAVRLVAYLKNNSNAQSYTGDGTSGLHILSAQIEPGLVSTSDIPTTTTALTRAADVALLSGSNFTSWFNPVEFSAVCSFVISPLAQASFICFSDGTTGNYVCIASSGTSLSVLVYSGSSLSANLSLGSVTAGSLCKVALACKANDFSASLNGATCITDTSGAMPVGLSRLNIGSGVFSDNPPASAIAGVWGYSKRLSNANLQALSTI